VLFAAANLPTAASVRRAARHTSRLFKFAAAPLGRSLRRPYRSQTTVAPAPLLAIRRGSNAVTIAYGVHGRRPKTSRGAAMMLR
jgi:hypothetical protein